MRLLALDTAAHTCGVALMADDDVLAQVSLDLGNTHAQVLMAAIDALLDLCDLSIAQIDGFVVTRGPGSFTGLRIGISTAKGLAAATQKPLVGVSTLETLAWQSPAGTPWVCSMMDARRQQVYWAVYERQDSRLVPKVAEQVGPAADVVAQVADGCTFIGNGVGLYKELLDRQLQVPVHWAPEALNAINPAMVARLGRQQLLTGRHERLDLFAPTYIRRSDAELAENRS